MKYKIMTPNQARELNGKINQMLKHNPELTLLQAIALVAAMEEDDHGIPEAIAAVVDATDGNRGGDA